jgi:alpha-L-fucosidase
MTAESTTPTVPFADRALPRWYDDAKLGIFVHWTSAAIPAFAPIGPSPFDLIDAAADWSVSFRNSPYVEWYWNSIAIDGSPAQRHHHERYGDAPYDQFVRQFADGLGSWRADTWADLFAKAGARYVVLVTKHHDGFCLWPTEQANPHRTDWHSERDIVGELGDAVREHQMRYGLYYSGGLDWTFAPPPIDTFIGMIGKVPNTPDYHEYCVAQVDELIDRYQPAMLWNDIAWPFGLDANDTFARYYAAVPDGIVNDRFNLPAQRSGAMHTDIVTPEYSTKTTGDRKFEVCRGIGTSFGYNADENNDTYLDPNELIRMFIDIVARGGNLLLNVGPNADGQIPWDQATRLLALGWWLDVHGEAIYDTVPWTRANGWTTDAEPVRFTTNRARSTLWASILRTPTARTVTLLDVPKPSGDVHLLGLADASALDWTHDGAHLTVTLPARLADAPAHVLRIAL